MAASFSGNLGLPVAETDSLSYDAVITEDNKYWLTVKPKKSLDFKLWKARVDLDSNSYIKMLVDNGNFRPEANLCGRMTVMRNGRFRQIAGGIQGHYLPQYEAENCGPVFYR